MARRKPKQAGGSLDSLLDTMTNVVGILVILLIVTQLGVSDAVTKITSEYTVSQAEIDAAIAQADKLKSQRDDLTDQLNALASPDNVDLKKELAALRRNVSNESANVRSLEESRGGDQQKQAALDAKKQQLAAALKEQETTNEETLTHEQTSLGEQIRQATEKQADLRAMLAEKPKPPALPPKIVNLPNPRPAPEGVVPAKVICREGRLIPINETLIQDRAQKRVAYLLRTKLGINDPKKEVVDGDKLAAAFNEDPLTHPMTGRPEFRIEMIVQGRYPKLVLNRTSTAGETTAQIANPTSQYQLGLAQLRAYNRGPGKPKYYLQFLVWPDSFETYITARQFVSKEGLFAGWHPQTTEGEYLIALGGSLRCGPPPKPTPSPPAGSGGTAKPGPQEPDRPRPDDAID